MSPGFKHWPIESPPQAQFFRNVKVPISPLSYPVSLENYDGSSPEANTRH